MKMTRKALGMIQTRNWMRLLSCLYIALLLVPTASAGWLSDGSDGAFSPAGNITLELPEDGIFNFTTINIPSNATVRFRKNALNTPVYLLATGTVTISGVIDVSAGGVNIGDLSSSLRYIRPATTAAGGPGGGTGGLAGFGDSAQGFLAGMPQRVRAYQAASQVQLPQPPTPKYLVSQEVRGAWPLPA